jgi:hypothetical protein
LFLFLFFFLKERKKEYARLITVRAEVAISDPRLFLPYGKMEPLAKLRRAHNPYVDQRLVAEEQVWS